MCNDAGAYVMFSYAGNSRYRNHDMYMLGAYHYHEEHSNDWQSCGKCKDDMAIENYVDYAMNDCNFEKLKNPSKISITCCNCSFKSNTVHDFTIQSSNGWYCAKKNTKRQA